MDVIMKLIFIWGRIGRFQVILLTGNESQRRKQIPGERNLPKQRRERLATCVTRAVRNLNQGINCTGIWVKLVMPH
ncbi:hypothetical protein K2173_008814 [Erythroxylum novogranatense]|uniref:Uncharacterized protein n=1 Tax=Erythroxylum novogranatense TaxID=1862640 RepID=A0AAV8SLB5_9ROSI|nr:hypothetical protein K2173_008814 [Erythroxylum novogranatense]